MGCPRKILQKLKPKTNEGTMIFGLIYKNDHVTCVFIYIFSTEWIYNSYYIVIYTEIGIYYSNQNKGENLFVKLIEVIRIQINRIAEVVSNNTKIVWCIIFLLNII